MAAAAALAVLATIEEEGLLERARLLGAVLRDGLRHSCVTEVRAEGLLVGVDLISARAAEVADAAQRRGFIVNACTPDRIRLAPPLVLTDDQVAELLQAWPMVLGDVFEGGAP